MKNKISDILTCILFCGFLFGMFAAFLLIPHQDFSEKEKRYLTQEPKLTWETLLNGNFGSDAEDYLAEQIPGRDFWVGLASYYDLLSNRQVTKDIYLAKGNRLVEPPIVYDSVAAEQKMMMVNYFADSIGQPVDLMIVPSAGYVLEDTILGLHADYTDDEIIRNIYDEAGDNVVCHDIAGVYEAAEDKSALYYRTDHHWTSLGAYTAYSAYMGAQEREHPSADSFRIERHGGFYGSTYSRSGLWLTPADDIELWQTNAALTVTIDNATHSGVFYRERLEELDKYTVYLDGNHGLVRIDNPENAGKGKILVIRDSYANCLGTFLAHSYETVVMVDLRYYKKPASAILEEAGFTDVLICYSLSNFMTDTNIFFLQ